MSQQPMQPMQPMLMVPSKRQAEFPAWVVPLIMGLMSGGGAGTVASSFTSSEALKGDILRLSDKVDGTKEQIQGLGRDIADYRREVNGLTERVHKLEVEFARNGPK